MIEGSDRFSLQERQMSINQEEKLVNKRVTYTLYKDGRFYIIENVPARVNEETSEQYFFTANG